jgi:two-component system, cell cycle sensor histidine kinase and response regulator CckA
LIRMDTFNIEFPPSEDAPPPHGLAPGPYVVLQVRDTGIGMAPSVSDRVFEPFYTTKELGAGTGLGLAAVYGTLKNHKGAVSVESTPGKGSVFSLFLPVTRREAAVLRHQEEPATLRLSGSVMVVDDEVAVRDVMSSMLKALGCTVLEFSDGESAIAYFRGQHRSVDLVLLDLMMPGMSGADTFAALKGIDPDVQVVIASGYSLDGQAQHLIDSGAQGFLQKPFNMTSLARRVSPLLRP